MFSRYSESLGTVGGLHKGQYCCPAHLDVLPDLILIRTKVEFVQEVNRQQRYLHRICALIIETHVRSLHFCRKRDERNSADEDPAWKILLNDEMGLQSFAFLIIVLELIQDAYN